MLQGKGKLGSASALARFFVGLVAAAEEKENLGSASALARFFMGLVAAAEEKENLGSASALARFFVGLVAAAEEKENLGSASALARFFVGLVAAAEEKENLGSASALARFFMGLADAAEENFGQSFRAGPVLHGVISCPSGVRAAAPVCLGVCLFAGLFDLIGVGGGLVVGLGVAVHACAAAPLAASTYATLGVPSPALVSLPSSSAPS